MPKANVLWTTEIETAAAFLARDGVPVIQIARTLGVEYPRISRFLLRSGIPKPRRILLSRRTWDASRDARVREMYLSGMPMREIWTKLKTNSRGVMESLKRSGTPSRPRYSFSTGDSNPAWRGGRQIDRDGYVLIHDPSHPNARKSGYVPEHRRVMAEALGRPLRAGEVVHHKRGRGDNSRSDLAVYASNADHLRDELKGRSPNWSEAGKRRIREAMPNRRNPFGVD